MTVPLLRIQNLQFNGKDKPEFGKVDLELADGEVLFVVGPIGCGKTTHLRLIAGLEKPYTNSQ